MKESEIMLALCTSYRQGSINANIERIVGYTEELCSFLQWCCLHLTTPGQGPWTFPNIDLHVCLISKTFPYFQDLLSDQSLHLVLSEAISFQKSIF